MTGKASVRVRGQEVKSCSRTKEKCDGYLPVRDCFKADLIEESRINHVPRATNANVVVDDSIPLVPRMDGIFT